MQLTTKASWGSEKWLIEAWNILDESERATVEKRMNDVFQDGLPLELKKDRVIYIYLFAMLTQLEIVAVHVPLKFLKILKNKKLEALMRQQLVDEIFHTMAFSKMAHELSVPYGYPPEFNQSIERICALVTNEDDIKTTVILLNLIAEGWIEQVFDMLRAFDIAPKLFDTIIEDEKRHVAESVLYREIGLPSKKEVANKLALVETELINSIFFQRTYVSAMINLIGLDGCIQLIENIDSQHQKQLAKIQLKPIKKWQSFVRSFPASLKQAYHDHTKDPEVELSSTRRVMLSNWQSASEATMFAMFGLNVTKLEIFEGKYPTHTLTGLILQAISKIREDNKDFRNYICHNKLYNSRQNHVHLVINLPGATNHIGLIKIKDCHKMSLQQLSEHVKHDIEIMEYCRYKSNELSHQQPKLLADYNEYFLSKPDNPFGDIHIPNPIYSLSNVGPWGHEQALSPLFPGEVVKVTISRPERKQVWNNQTKSFDIQDQIPIGVTCDHRVYDGNTITPKICQIVFDEMFEKMIDDDKSANPISRQGASLDKFIKLTNDMIADNIDFAFRFLMSSSHHWNNEFDIDLLLDKTKNTHASKINSPVSA